MRKLYEINQELERLLDEAVTVKLDGENAVDTESGEVFNLAERLNELQIERNEKIKGCVVYLDDLNSKAAQLKEKVDKLNAQKKSLEREIAGITEYLLTATERKGFKDDDIEMKVKQTVKCVVFDEEAVPERFIKTKVETSVSKSDITKAIKAGEEVPGAELRPNYTVNIL